VFAISVTSVILTAFIALLSFLCTAAYFCAKVQVFKKTDASIFSVDKTRFPLLMEAGILDFWYTLRGNKIFICDSYVNAGFCDVVPSSLVEKTQARWRHITATVFSAEI
jgi:cellulose synthase/poly-beta-1,6-N-acetylglucosamine synthase-like glycosyltransferase